MKTKFLLIICFVFFSGANNSFSKNILFVVKEKSLIYLLQSGNSISGFVFISKGQTLPQTNVELLDEFERTVSRTRTDGAGRYSFYRLPAGNYKVRVTPSETGYEEQIQNVEIVNVTRRSSNGGLQISGSENVQLDFYLRPRKKQNNIVGNSNTIFVQDIPESAKLVYDDAVSKFKNNNNDAALKELENATEIFPDYYDALNRLGQEYIKIGQYKSAKKVLENAVKVNPRSAETWYALAYSFYVLKEYKEAVEPANKAVNLKQNSAESAFLLGVILRQVSDYDNAERYLKHANTLAKESLPDVHWQLALLYANNLKRFNLAADELELFLKFEPNSRDAENIKKLIANFRAKANTVVQFNKE